MPPGQLVGSAIGILVSLGGNNCGSCGTAFPLQQICGADLGSPVGASTWEGVYILGIPPATGGCWDLVRGLVDEAEEKGRTDLFNHCHQTGKSHSQVPHAQSPSHPLSKLWFVGFGFAFFMALRIKFQNILHARQALYH